METIEYNILRPVFNQDHFDKLHGYEQRKRKIKNFNYYEYLNIQKIGSILTNTFPFFKWIKDYQLGFLPSDIAAGITIAIFNIPQGMAYANLANLPEVIGLYTSFFCPLIYLFFGTSRHLSMGIVSVVALMMGSTLEKYAILHNFNLENAKQNNIDNFESLHYLTILTFTTGIILALLSMCQAHFIAAYLSDSLVHGFTTAAAIHTIWSQIPKILGISVASRSGFLKLYYISLDIASKITKTNWPDFIISICCILALLFGNLIINPRFTKRFRIPFPFELLIVIILILLSKFFNFNSNYNVAIIAKIPKGLPTIHIPKMSLFVQVLPDAIAIAIVIYAFSLSVAKLIAKRHHYVIHSGQELFAYAFCNIISSFFLCHPSAGSLTRTIISSTVGSKSQISSVFASSIVLLVILWVANLLESLPKCVLSSIIIVALKSMLSQFVELPKLWKYSKFDFLIWIVAFTATVSWDVIEGLSVAVVFAIMTILFRLQWPNFIELAPIKETDIYVEYKYYNLSIPEDKILAFCYESPLLFFNQENFKCKFYDFYHASQSYKHSIEFVIFDASSISLIDTAGTAAISEILQFLKEKNIEFLISCCKVAIRNSLKTQGIPPEIFFPTLHDAFLHTHYQISKENEYVTESQISFV